MGTILATTDCPKSTRGRFNAVHAAPSHNTQEQKRYADCIGSMYRYREIYRKALNRNSTDDIYISLFPSRGHSPSRETSDGPRCAVVTV